MHASPTNQATLQMEWSWGLNKYTQGKLSNHTWHHFHLVTSHYYWLVFIYLILYNIYDVLIERKKGVVKEGCEASRNPRDWWGETRPSPPGHQKWKWKWKWEQMQLRLLLLRGAQIPQSVGVGPSICRIVLPGSHRLGPPQSGSDHQGSCHTLTRRCYCMQLLLLPSCIPTNIFMQMQSNHQCNSPF